VVLTQQSPDAEAPGHELANDRCGLLLDRAASHRDAAQHGA
jgi:hypothetical protein